MVSADGEEPSVDPRSDKEPLKNQFGWHHRNDALICSSRSVLSSLSYLPHSSMARNTRSG